VASVQTCPAQPDSHSCQYYACLDERFQCGAEGYPLKFALPACEWFGSFCGGLLTSAESHAWVASVTVCLQDSIEHKQTALQDCQQLATFAFDSHAYCYTNGAKQYGGPRYCDLTATDKDLIYQCLESFGGSSAEAKADLDQYMEELKKACQSK